MLEHDLTGVPKTIPVPAGAVRDAYLGGAARLVHGYYETRAGKLHFEIAEEDAARHRMLQTVAEDGDVAVAMNRAAKSLAPAAHEFLAPDAASAAWGQGDYERAVALDPAFGMAWLAWVQQLSAGGDNGRAREVAERALAQPALDSPIDKARLELAAATLGQDDAARLAASRKLAQLVPYDPTVLAEVARLEMAARQFGEAARDYRLVLAASPTDPSAVLNSLGYAEGMAGDLDGARKAFQEYGRGPGQDAVNALDSLGEALFINGKFDEAERQFLEAYQKDPAFLQGETLWKAAHARWLSGDLPGADKIAERYFQERAKARDPLLAWRRANWFYETGRRQQAVDLLQSPTAAGGAASVARQQLEVWNNPQALAADQAKLQQVFEHTDPVNDSLPRILYADALFHAGKKEQARELVKRWPLPIRDDSPLQSLLYPKFLELRKDLN